MNRPDLIGIFGGTFDPVHNGHIQSVLSVYDEFGFESIYLLPSSTPPHRPQTQSTPADRMKMVELAIADYPQLKADDRESKCTGKSYTIDTLKSFRTQFPRDSLAFIAGMDAYLTMTSWKSWQDYLDYVHIIVMKRPGFDRLDNAWGRPYLTDDKAGIFASRSGNIYYADSVELAISSTDIRCKLKTGQNLDSELPAPVRQYINSNQLYAHT